MNKLACLAMICFAMPACKGGDDTPPGKPAQPAVDVGEGSAPAPTPASGEPSGPVVLHPTPQPNTKDSVEAAAMKRCPSAVTGATTLVSDTPDGIALTVTAREATAIADVRERAAKVVLYAASDNGAGARCPVVTAATKIVVKEATGGARLELTPTDKAALDALRKEVRARAAGFPAPSDAPPSDVPPSADPELPAPTGSDGELVPS